MNNIGYAGIVTLTIVERMKSASWIWLPQLALWPGMLNFLTAIVFDFVSDDRQDALDPRSERR
jgi:ABC-type dipeptide/oligopeptide/nickel transport system permease subunit